MNIFFSFVNIKNDFIITYYLKKTFCPLKHLKIMVKKPLRKFINDIKNFSLLCKKYTIHADKD